MKVQCYYSVTNTVFWVKYMVRRVVEACKSGMSCFFVLIPTIKRMIKNLKFKRFEFNSARKQGIRFWDERTFWHEIIYNSLIPTFGKPTEVNQK